MTIERWNQIKDLVSSAQSIADAGRRESFVRAQCGDDHELRREVMSLVESHDAAGEFLETPALGDATTDEQVTETGPNLVGARVGAYRIVREIGHGGMGTVYLAIRADNEFRKQVAIKLIRRGMENDFAVRRFRNERQILARLEHPNIARLIDGGATSTGHPYFVMEHVEGQAILAHCESRKLSVRQRVEIFLQACAAVHYAHRRMIVHRDIKPGNILVMEDGTPKLLDFGIAKILDPEAVDAADATVTGFRLITPAYASPEQIHGGVATLRSDIYSLAVVLWEMVTGRREGHERAFELPDIAPTDPDWAVLLNLRNVVLRATRPKPEERYDSVEALSADLRKALAGGEVASPDRPDAPVTEAPQQGSIAILPFQMLGSDTTSESYLGLGIADAVITRLSNIGRIAVRPTGAVLKFSAGADALEAGRELNVQFVLEGRVRKANDRVRVTVQLVEVQTNGPIWAASFEDDVADLLKMEHSISEQLAQALIPQLSGEEREYLAQRGTTSAKAHEAYLRGRWYWNKHTEESMPQALVLFTEAIAEDPKYGRAHAGVADYYIALGVRGLLPPIESFAAAIQSARTAIELDPKLAEAHASLGLALWMHDRDHETATHHLQLAIALNPDYAVAHDWLGLMNSARGRPEIALACIERARKLDPNSALYAADLAMCQYVARQYKQAIEYLSFRRAWMKANENFGVSKSPEEPAVINEAALPLTLLASGRTAEALQAARQFVDASGRSSLALAVLARAEAAAGDTARAQDLLDDLNAKARDYYVSGIPLALANLACNRKVEAITQLQRACRDRDWWTPWLDLMPAWDDLRDHPRFHRFLETPTGRASRVTHRIEDPITGQQARSQPWRKETKRIAVVAVAVMAIVAAVLYLKFRTVRPPFQNPIISKLTTNGLAERAAISPDGQYVAFSIRMEGKASIWLKKLNDGTTYQLAGPFDGLISSLQFTRGGKNVAFVTTPVNDARGGALYLVPVNGGTTQVAMSGISVPVGVSPDESQFAYYRVDTAGSRDQLVLVNAREANSGGRMERVIDSRAHPQDFGDSLGPVWSPDGRRLAVAVTGPLKSGFGIRLDVIDLNDVTRTLNGPVWQNIAAIAWMKDSRGLMVAGRDRDGPFQQIWYVPLNGGAAVRITNDLNNYNAIGVTADESALVSVQSQTVTNLYSLRLDDPKHPVQITSGGGRYFDLAWTPGHNLVYASDATGSAEIWSIDRTSKAQRQLTNGSGQNYQPAVSPDGRTIVFQSNRAGVWNIWKTNPDGTNQTQVTADASDSTYPQFTADGSSLVYQHLDSDARQTIWKTPVAGGTPRQSTSLLTMYPTMAEDGRMASWISKSVEYPNWMIAIYEPGASTPNKMFSFPSNRMPGVRLRWIPGKNAVSYMESLDGVSNIWMIPVSTGVPVQLTSFTSGKIYSFDWSHDGTLAYSQGMNTNDVVLMRQSGR